MELKGLTKQFDARDIEWRVQRDGVKDGKVWAIVLAYVTNRAIMDRLDEVVGPENWCNQYEAGPSGGVLCGLSINIAGDWITKWDGSENTDIESVKGGLSGAMKRAAVQWGIGRYLYHLDAAFANIIDGGRYRGFHKDSKTPYRWNPPQLPGWALPEGHKNDNHGNNGHEASVDEAYKRTVQYVNESGLAESMVKSYLKECEDAYELADKDKLRGIWQRVTEAKHADS